MSARTSVQRVRPGYIALVVEDSELRDGALEILCAALDANPTKSFAYGDELFGAGRNPQPYFAPPFSATRLRAQCVESRPIVVRSAALPDDSALRETASDWELLLRASEWGPGHHVPQFLARSTRRRSHLPSDAAVTMMNAHYDRIGLDATVRASDETGILRLEPGPLSRSVSIVIPTAGRTKLVEANGVVMLVERCVRSIATSRAEGAVELVVVIDERAPMETADRIRLAADGMPLTIVEGQGHFDFSDRVNRGSIAAEGELLVLLNDDIEVIEPEWLSYLAAHADEPGVGAVGARLLYPDMHIQHAGVVLADTGPAHAHRGLPDDWRGDQAELLVSTDVAAVTGACLLTPRAVYLEAGGFSRQLPVNYNDVDYCLKLRRLGYRTVVSAMATLVHHESVSRGAAPVSAWEVDRFRSRWNELWGADPHRHPALRRHVNLVIPDPRSIDPSSWLNDDWPGAGSLPA